jgi:4-methylaminobutanoate oxidase (formaldehyde-forming)
MSFMSKFRVKGKDAGKTLNWISANNVDNDCGVITYTQWLNTAGCIEADLTVTKLGEDDFLVIATDTALRHVQSHFYRHAPDHVQMVDVTSGFGLLNVQGPLSRQLLQTLTSVDMSNGSFPFRHARYIDIGFARVLCIRVTYVGELGYELYVPSEQVARVYDRLVEVGSSFGLAHAGLKALSSCRMEKAYRDFGHDLDNTDNVVDAGLGMFVDFNKPGGFVGKDCVVRHKASGDAFKSRLLQVLCLDPDPCLFHSEPVLRNGRSVGYVRSASYGHSLGGAVGLAMIHARDRESTVNQDYITSGKWEVNIAGILYPARVSTAPMYDPKSERVKA